PPDAAHQLAHPTNAHKPYLRANESCASGPYKDETPPQNSAAALRNQAAYKSAEISARRPAPDFSPAVSSRRLSPHRRGVQFLQRLIHVAQSVLGPLDRIQQSVLIAVVLRP